MKGLLLTHPGCEDLTATEAKELVDAHILEQQPGFVIIDATEEALLTLCYLGRTLTRVIVLLDDFTFEESPIERFKTIDVKPWLGKSVTVVCERSGSHPFTSFDVQNAYCNMLKSQTEIDHKKPETIIYVYIVDTRCLVGIDLVGFDLGRRDYRVFLSPDSLKGNLAAGLLKLAEYQPKHVLLDPFCRDGIIPIEAALMATKTSPHQFIKEKFAFCKLLPFQAYHFDDFFKKLDKEREFKGTIHALDPNFKNVQHTKKNAKIAGVVKLLEFGRAELEFLDAKFGKEAVDSIVTVPMQPSRQIPDNLYEKVIHNLFYHADFILKKDGKMVLAIKRGQEQIKKKAAELNFILIHERTVKTGEESLTLLVFSPQAPSSSPGTRP